MGHSRLDEIITKLDDDVSRFRSSQEELRDDLVAAAVDLQRERDELRHHSEELVEQINRISGRLEVAERWRHRFHLALRFYLDQAKTGDDSLSREAVAVIQRILEGESGEELVAE